MEKIKTNEMYRMNICFDRASTRLEPDDFTGCIFLEGYG